MKIKDKHKIENIANAIINKFECIRPVDVQEIAVAENLTIEKMPFRYNLDGMLVFFNGIFKIFLNSNIFHEKTEQRKRFTIAHELGHYYILEHKYQIIEEGAIYSKTEYKSDEEMERQADYFASCLLMPRIDFISEIKEPFSIQQIESLSYKFNVSILSIIHRCIELDLFPICIHRIQNGIVKWWKAADSFQYHVKDLNRLNVPLGTIAHRIVKSNEYVEEKEEVDVDAWCTYRFNDEYSDFENEQIDQNNFLMEYCFNHGNQILTNIIWEK